MAETWLLIKIRVQVSIFNEIIWFSNHDLKGLVSVPKTISFSGKLLQSNDMSIHFLISSEKVKRTTSLGSLKTQESTIITGQTEDSNK